MANSTITYNLMKLIEHYFLHMTHNSIPVLWTLDNTLALCLAGGMLNSKIAYKKHKIQKCGTNEATKKTVHL